jgi:hypothetical protein
LRRCDGKNIWVGAAGEQRESRARPLASLRASMLDAQDMGRLISRQTEGGGRVSELAFIVSMILLFAGSIMLLVEAFSESVLWGLGCLLLAFPVALLFVLTHWGQAKKAVFVQIAGMILLVVAAQSGAR